MIAQLSYRIVHTTNPLLRTLQLAPSFPSLCGDRPTGSFNLQLVTVTTSRRRDRRHVIGAVGRRAGLADSRAIYIGDRGQPRVVLCARAEPNGTARDGACLRGPPVFYISRDSHLAG
jgi:hypothetical protein